VSRRSPGPGPQSSQPVEKTPLISNGVRILIGDLRKCVAILSYQTRVEGERLRRSRGGDRRELCMNRVEKDISLLRHEGAGEREDEGKTACDLRDMEWRSRGIPGSPLIR
ncbi:MAG: hypothetical protein ACREVJ_02350, partial [Gammaproteobacteria bacterium]